MSPCPRPTSSPFRLNALTIRYAPLWTELFDARWAGYEDWANPNWPRLKPQGDFKVGLTL